MSRRIRLVAMIALGVSALTLAASGVAILARRSDPSRPIPMTVPGSTLGASPTGPAGLGAVSVRITGQVTAIGFRREAIRPFTLALDSGAATDTGPRIEACSGPDQRKDGDPFEPEACRRLMVGTGVTIDPQDTDTRAWRLEIRSDAPAPPPVTLNLSWVDAPRSVPPATEIEVVAAAAVTISSERLSPLAEGRVDAHLVPLEDTAAGTPSGRLVLTRDGEGAGGSAGPLPLSVVAAKMAAGSSWVVTAEWAPGPARLALRLPAGTAS